jgi:hypothetical protein
LGQLEGERARAQESTVRRERLEEEAAEVTREAGLAQDALARARAELDRGLVALDALDSRRVGLETEREERREAVQSARSRTQAAQIASRDLLIRIESRRSSESSMGVGLKRMADQRAQTQARGSELEAALANGDQPIIELESKLRDFLARRIDVEVSGSTATLKSVSRKDKLNKIEIEGAVVSGTCTSFVVNGTTITTDAATKYSKGACANVVAGALVQVKGSTLADATVRATDVMFKTAEGDDPDDADGEGKNKLQLEGAGLLTIASLLPPLAIAAAGWRLWKFRAHCRALRWVQP